MDLGTTWFHPQCQNVAQNSLKKTPCFDSKSLSIFCVFCCSSHLSIIHSNFPWLFLVRSCEGARAQHSFPACLFWTEPSWMWCVCFSVPRKNRFWTSLWSLERYWYVWKAHIFVGLPVLFEVFTCIDWRKHIDTSSTCYIFVLHFR